LANIFLSYAREDVNKAKLLAVALESEGWSVFWDRSSLLAGQDFDVVIEKAINEAECMIVVWSAAAKQSDWVRGEATIGRERKILVPILLESVDPPIAFRYLHTENFVGWHGDKKSASYLALCKALNARIDKAKAEEPLSQSINKSTPTQPRWHFRTSPKIIAITGILVFVIALFSFEVPYFSSRPASEINRDKALDPIQSKEPELVKLPVSPSPSQIKEPDMVRLPGGAFYMGSDGSNYEEPVHLVKIDSFLMGRTEVTFDEYDRFAEATGKPKPTDEGWGRGTHPVIKISWEDAVAYAAWLSKETGKNFHLPSEAQWEYAARAGTASYYYWDQGEDKDFAWFSENSGQKTHPVGEKLPNAFGLYDMSGNVWEWVQDCWHKNYDNAPEDRKSWQEQNNGDCSLRVLRGGSWSTDAYNVRSANRYWYNPDFRNFNDGFRLAQD
jgi:formylglycine-generating enzyme required for sulfatase activity